MLDGMIHTYLRVDKLRHDIVEYAKGCWSTRKCSAAANLLMVNLTTHGEGKNFSAAHILI